MNTNSIESSRHLPRRQSRYHRRAAAYCTRNGLAIAEHVHSFQGNGCSQKDGSLGFCDIDWVRHQTSARMTCLCLFCASSSQIHTLYERLQLIVRDIEQSYGYRLVESRPETCCPKHKTTLSLSKHDIIFNLCQLKRANISNEEADCIISLQQFNDGSKTSTATTATKATKATKATTAADAIWVEIVWRHISMAHLRCSSNAQKDTYFK
ncbi:uncharacterized protein LY89DRAFT_396681 [Mollisia scopiformis]|uniref:Uncharacterized protein n=1 Tax=Mollisia scopiformis TaxID=149040 RepID=A0A132B2Z6_MOLSC|nr:uncharacterized protein LY89DRAFT_396681 [Mollisia scopiformis]KUJ06778.1 hypothetical protein LY89DRAFT_396681 [Mollisia scopiformis]